MADDPSRLLQTFQRMERDLLSVVGVDGTAEPDPSQRFAVGLLKADVIHAATVGRDDRQNIERYTAMFALYACIERINSDPELRDAQLAAPLVRLLSALTDLDQGKVQPMLRPQKRSRSETGPRSRHESTLRGHLAGTVDALMWRANMREPEAAHWVQRWLSARGVKLKAAQLIQWRKEARNAKKDDFMRIAFHKVLATTDWRDPLQTADSLLEGFLKLI